MKHRKNQKPKQEIKYIIKKRKKKKKRSNGCTKIYSDKKKKKYTKDKTHFAFKNKK